MKTCRRILSTLALSTCFFCCLTMDQARPTITLDPQLGAPVKVVHEAPGNQCTLIAERVVGGGPDERQAEFNFRNNAGHEGGNIVWLERTSKHENGDLMLYGKGYSCPVDVPSG